MNLEAILTILITIAQITTVYLAARGNRWTWVFSIVTGLILCYNFFTDRHFMSFAFQVYSILASVGGVFIWKKKAEDNRRTICWGNPLWPLLAVVGIAAATYLFDTHVLHSNLPVLDCAIFSLQAVATFLMVRKDINAWICYPTYGFITFLKAWKATRKEQENA